MQTRVIVHQLEPQAIKNIYAQEKYIAASGLSKSLIHLIKTRASQINGCAFCINMHTRDAIKAGESAKRLFLLDAWREAQVFSELEQAALQLTEEITLIHQAGVSDETYARVQQHFDDHQIAQLIVAISTINVWNRIAVATHMPLDD